MTIPPIPAFAALLAAPPLPQAEGGGPRMGAFLLQIAALGAIFYFVLLAPQRKEKKRHAQMLQELSKGDKVLTNGGVIGKIVHATDRELTIKTGEDTRLVLDRGYVAAKLNGEDEGKGAAATAPQPARRGFFGGGGGGGLAGRAPKR